MGDVKIAVGGSYVRVTDTSTRNAAILLLVDGLDITPEEVSVARKQINGDNDG